MRGRAPLRIITRHPACATASQTRAGQARGSSERVQALCGPRSGASGTHPHRSAGARGPAPQRRAGGRPCGFCVHAPPSCGRSSPAGQRRAGRRAPRSHRHCAPAPMRRGSCNGEELHSVCCQQRSTFLLLLTLLRSLLLLLLPARHTRNRRMLSTSHLPTHHNRLPTHPQPCQL